MRFALGLIFFPIAAKYDSRKPSSFLVLLFFFPVFITGHKSAETSLERRVSQLAINRARFDTDERASMSKDEAVCAQIDPDTVSITNAVKLLPTCPRQ